MRWNVGAALALSLLVGTALTAQPRARPGAEAPREPLVAGTLGTRQPPTPRTVTPPGEYALSIDGAFELGGYVFRDGHPFLHNDGGTDAGNTALGIDALISLTTGDPDPTSGLGNTAVGFTALVNTTSGSSNTAVGTCALYQNTTGSRNVALGAAALLDNESGSFNTANGTSALFSNSTGDYNTAVGYSALFANLSGDYNTAVGAAALFNTEGSRNSALGYRAGVYNSTGSDNIWIGSFGYDESNTLRIGGGTGTGEFQQKRAFISGIRDVTTGQSDAIPVLIDSDGQLGTASSSQRFKDEIRDMGKASEGLGELRPVTFRYREPFADGSRPLRYGLIAEEVAEVFPELVAYDDEGRPEAVFYRFLTPMLLNELQKHRWEVLFHRWTLGAMLVLGIALTARRYRGGRRRCAAVAPSHARVGGRGHAKAIEPRIRHLAIGAIERMREGLGRLRDRLETSPGSGRRVHGSSGRGRSVATQWTVAAVVLWALMSTPLTARPPGDSALFGSDEPLVAGPVGRSGARPPRAVVPPGEYALSIDGAFELGDYVFRDGHPFLHDDGGSEAKNVGFGIDTLIYLTTGDPYDFSGTSNTAVGFTTLPLTTSGNFNTALGINALFANTTGSRNAATGNSASFRNEGSGNTASGGAALFGVTDGSYNAGVGYAALGGGNPGDANTAAGVRAILVTLGTRNIALGYRAARDTLSGSDNIWIGSFGGEEEESNTLRIGGGTGNGDFEQKRAFISGVRGATTGQPDALEVLIDSEGQLGTAPSSRRVKDEIRDMGEASERLADLRAVTFRYRESFEDGARPLRYGLIAEEVAKVFPELVAYDEEGRPQAVLYRFLTPMLLNELQKQRRDVARHRWALGALFLVGLALASGPRRSK